MPRTFVPQAGQNVRVAEHNLYDFREIARNTGNIFFVDSGASASGSGMSPDDPCTTLAAANTLATASNGDVIFVMEGHAETYTAATTAISKIGVRVIGLGQGRNRPTWTFTTANGASFDVTAASVTIENCVFLNARDGQTAMINVSAADFAIRDCEFALTDLEASSTTQAVVGILATDAADRLIVERCHMHGEFATGVTSAISYGACDNVIIRGCVITGNHTTAGSIANTAAAVGGLIVDNYIVNGTADAQNNAIVLHASTVSLVANNRLAVLDSSSPIPIIAAAGYISANYITGAVGTTASVLK